MGGASGDATAGAAVPAPMQGAAGAPACDVDVVVILGLCRTAPGPRRTAARSCADDGLTAPTTPVHENHSRKVINLLHHPCMKICIESPLDMLQAASTTQNL